MSRSVLLRFFLLVVFVCFSATVCVADDIAALMAKAAKGDAKAQSELGIMYLKGEAIPRDDAKGLEWTQKAAAQGHAAAQFNIGLMHATGKGVARDDAKAVEWYAKSAAQGYAPAEANLGGMYAEGLGVEKNDVKAVEWFQMAAVQGHAMAQFNLANRYAGGLGISKDETKAAEWLQKSALQGYPAAQFNLGVMNENGIAGPKDFVKAFVWYSLAARQNDADAVAQLAVLTRGMTAAQKEEAQKDLAELQVATTQQNPASSATEIINKGMRATVLVVMQNEAGKDVSFGSGFFVGDDLIATNQHVVKGGKPGYYCTVDSATRYPLTAVIASDAASDLALIRVTAGRHQRLLLGNSTSLKVGEDITTIGNPQGLKGTVAKGNVSGFREMEGIRRIQITAPISHGSSGGPVLNASGEVVGITVSTVDTGQNLNFAVPIEALQILLNKARR